MSRFEEALQRLTLHSLTTAVVASVAVVALFGALLALGLTRPTFERETGERVLYTQSGTFNYATRVGPSLLHGNRASVPAGEPAGRAVARAIDVWFNYDLASDADAESQLAGQVTLTGTLSDGSAEGWQYQLPVLATQKFTGSTATANATVELGEINDLLARITAELEGPLSEGELFGRGHLSITAEVTTVGTVDGEAVEETFSQVLGFSFDRTLVAVDLQDVTEIEEALSTQTPRNITTTQVSAALMPVPGLAMSVQAAREIGVAGLAVAALALLISAVLLSRRVRLASTDERIASDYGGRIVDINGRVSPPAGAARIEVREIDDLVRVAELNGLPILHEAGPDGSHRYYVQDTALYEYRAAAGLPPALTPAFATRDS